MGMLLLTSSPAGLWPWNKLAQAERGQWEVTGLTCEGPSSGLPTSRNFWRSDITVSMAVTCSHEPWTSGLTGGLETETGTGRGQNSPCSRLNPSCMLDTEQGLQLGLSNRPLSSNSRGKETFRVPNAPLTGRKKKKPKQNFSVCF